MSMSNKEIVAQLSEQLTLDSSLAALEDSLVSLGLAGNDAADDLGSDDTGEPPGLREKVRRKVRTANPDRFEDYKLNQLGKEVLKRLDRIYDQANARVNLIFRVTVTMYVVQFLVLSGGALLTLTSRVTVDTLKAVAGVLPGAIGGTMHVYYRSERGILSTLEKERRTVLIELLKGSGVSQR